MTDIKQAQIPSFKTTRIYNAKLNDIEPKLQEFVDIAKNAFYKTMTDDEVVDHITNVDVLFYGLHNNKVSYFWRA